MKEQLSLHWCQGRQPWGYSRASSFHTDGYFQHLWLLPDTPGAVKHFPCGIWDQDFSEGILNSLAF